MRLSAQEEYGLRCLLQVAAHRGDQPLQIGEIATAEGLSPEYVAKLMRVLRQGGLVVSTRGAGGGYHLARPAKAITLAEVIGVLDGPLIRNDLCQSYTGQLPRCVHDTGCSVRVLWNHLGQVLDGVLRRLTLADLVAGTPTVTARLAPSVESP